jgi:hypothetical protein
MENMKELIISDIKNKIFTIRGIQVMLDKDLARLYDVDIRRLNEQVKRNIERFPKNFMFQLTDKEFNILKSEIATTNFSLRSQNATLKNNRGKHRKYLPYVFTEQGISMLSGILRSKTAIQVSINIMNAFIGMKKFISSNAQIFQRLDRVELKQLEHNKKFKIIFDALQNKEMKQGIFFEEQVFDAYKFTCDLVKKAKKEIVLIDNYIDESVLTLFSKRKKGIKVKIFIKKISKQLELDVKKFNSQFEQIEICKFINSHDRFLIIDCKDIYHFGASLKDLGKKWFAFSKFEKGAVNMLKKLNNN